MVIDGHNHIGGPDSGDGQSQSAEQLIASMDAADVHKAVVFPFNNPGSDGSFRSANDVVAEAAQAYPERLIGLGRVDPNMGEIAILEAERCFIQCRFAGLKLHPKAQSFGLSDASVKELLQLVADYSGIVIFDSGTSAAPWKELSILAARFPHISMVAAHMYGDGYLDAAELAPNLYLGTTDIANKARIEEAVAVLGARQVISGSDSPYIEPAAERDKIMSLNISDEDKALIGGGNMERILGR